MSNKTFLIKHGIALIFFKILKQTFRGGIIGISKEQKSVNLIKYFVIGSLKTVAENHLAQLASGLKKRGWDVEIYLLSPYVEVEASI